jgi:hypothetical protein
MFTEDLAQFFDSANGFAIAVTFKTAANAKIRDANVILTDARGAAIMFDNQVLAALPFIQCRTVDLVSVDNTCKVTIGIGSAAVTYQIVEHSDDGTGTSLVQLRK